MHYDPFLGMFDLSSQKSKDGIVRPNYNRNITIVLGCIAEKLAGPRSVALFTPGTLNYLISNLVRKQGMVYFTKIVLTYCEKKIRIDGEK